MHTRLRQLISTVALVTLAGGFSTRDTAAGPLQGADTKHRTVWDGVYNQEQVARGQQLFMANCAVCHMPDLSGKNGPTLKGDRFTEDWREANLNILFNTVRTMPPNNSQRSTAPRLPDPVYLDILTYILQGNGFPAGSEELTLGALPAVQFEKKTGPDKVPNLALVNVVGCLTQVSSETWTLTKAGEPVRTMNPEEISPAELQAGEVQPLGTKTYRLNEIDRLGSPIDPSKDHKVEVKGSLVRGADNSERINITALGMVSATCR